MKPHRIRFYQLSIFFLFLIFPLAGCNFNEIIDSVFPKPKIIGQIFMQEPSGAIFPIDLVQVEVDGKVLDTSKSSGKISFSTGDGSHKIRLFWQLPHIMLDTTIFIKQNDTLKFTFLRKRNINTTVNYYEERWTNNEIRPNSLNANQVVMFINGLVAQTRSNLSIEYIAKLDSGYNYFSIFANGKNFDTLIYVTDSKPLYITKKLRTTLPDKVYDIPIAIGTEWVYKFTSTYYYGRSIVLNTPYRYTNTIEGEMNIKVASQMLFSTNATYYCTTRVIGALFSRQYGVTETTSSVSPIDGKCLIIKNNEEIRFDGITFPNPNYSSTASLSIPLRVRGDVGDTILINSTIRIANRIGLLEYCHGWSRNYQNEAMNACLFLMSKTN